MGKPKVKRICPGLYRLGQYTILHMDDPDWKESLYYGYWIVQRDHYEYSDPVRTYREAKKIAMTMEAALTA